jgi:hypothetical protein
MMIGSTLLAIGSMTIANVASPGGLLLLPGADRRNRPIQEYWSSPCGLSAQLEVIEQVKQDDKFGAAIQTSP